MACTMKDVRKGTDVRLRNGLDAEVLDNLTNRATRMCKVFGAAHGGYDEMGSVYSSDIVEAHIGGQWEFVTHSTKTLQTAQVRQSWGF